MGAAGSGGSKLNAIWLSHETLLLRKGPEKFIITRRDGIFATYLRLLEGMQSVSEPLTRPYYGDDNDNDNDNDNDDDYGDDSGFGYRDDGAGGSRNEFAPADVDLEAAAVEVVVDADATGAATAVDPSVGHHYTNGSTSGTQQMRRRAHTSSVPDGGDEDDDAGGAPRFEYWSDHDVVAVVATDDDDRAGSDAAGASGASMQYPAEDDTGAWLRVSDVSLYSNFRVYELVQSIEASMLMHMADELTIECRNEQQQAVDDDAAAADDAAATATVNDEAANEVHREGIRRRMRMELYRRYLRRYQYGIEYHMLATECMDRFEDVLLAASAAAAADDDVGGNGGATNNNNPLSPDLIQTTLEFIARARAAKCDFLFSR